METKRVTVDFASRAQISFSGESIKSQLDVIETHFTSCNDILRRAEMEEINYEFQSQEINGVADIISILTDYVSSVPLQVESELDKPLTADFQNNVIPALTKIVINDIRSQGMSIHIHGDARSMGNADDMQIIREIGLDSFLNITNCMSLEDMQSPENLRAVDIFINLFRVEFENQMGEEIRRLNGNSNMSLVKLCMGKGEITEGMLKEYEGNILLQGIPNNQGALGKALATFFPVVLTALQGIRQINIGINNEQNEIEAIGYADSTKQLIVKQEGDPFLTPRINDDGSITIGYGYDFTPESDPDTFEKYLAYDDDGNMIVINTMSQAEAEETIKLAADKKEITSGLENFISGEGNGNKKKPLTINQNQYDALFSYFYSNGPAVFTNEKYVEWKGYAEEDEINGKEYEERAEARIKLRDYIIENNENYDSEKITELFVKSKGANLKYEYEERRTAEAQLFMAE